MNGECSESKEKTRTGKRAFASTLVAVLAVVFVSALAAVLLASSAHQRALISSFESRKAANHFDNVVLFLNASFRDALFDSVSPNSVGDLSVLSAQYLRLAALELNKSIETNFSGLRVQSTSAPPFEGFDYAVVADASFELFVRQGSAFKNDSVFFEQRVDVNDTGINWKANLSGLLVVVPPSQPPP